MRLRRSFILLGSLACLSLALPSAGATPSTKASPAPKVKASSTTLKSLPLPLTPAPKAGTSTKKSAAKTSAKILKKSAPVHHYYYSAPKPKPTPSPTLVWPPKGFTPNSDNSAYAKVPSGGDLVSLLSAKTTLMKTVVACETSACSAVYVAGAADCTYWEVDATVKGPSLSDITRVVSYGTLKVLSGGTKAKTITPIFLVSNEPLIPHEALILQTLGISKAKLYEALNSGRSLLDIADTKLASLEKVIMGAESAEIDAKLAAGTIDQVEATAEKAELPVRVAYELDRYNLSIGDLHIQCFTDAPATNVPATTYTPLDARS